MPWDRVGGGGAYLLTKHDFRLKNDKIAFKLGNHVDCYQLLPTLTASGMVLTTLTAYQTAVLLRPGGNKTLNTYVFK